MLWSSPLRCVEASGVPAPICCAHISWNEHRKVKACEADCRLWCIQTKKKNWSFSFLTYMVLLFHRLERGEEMAELLPFGKNYFVVMPVDSNWNKSYTVRGAIITHLYLQVVLTSTWENLTGWERSRLRDMKLLSLICRSRSYHWIKLFVQDSSCICSLYFFQLCVPWVIKTKWS